jgi:hypothetical protein
MLKLTLACLSLLVQKYRSVELKDKNCTVPLWMKTSYLEVLLHYSTLRLRHTSSKDHDLLFEKK